MTDDHAAQPPDDGPDPYRESVEMVGQLKTLMLVLGGVMLAFGVGVLLVAWPAPLLLVLSLLCVAVGGGLVVRALRA